MISPIEWMGSLSEEAFQERLAVFIRPFGKWPSGFERFYAHINKDGPIIRPELGPCWEWVGARIRSGYGELQVQGKTYKTHRLAWIIEVGSIPAGLLACHKCDNPPCVRVAHLFLGTPSDNTQDAVRKGRKGKINQAIADAIRAEYAETRTDQRIIAAKYGISGPSVSQIVTGKRWVQ